ncbi:MAG: malto-oligosyltrehalose trehalohydrolase [Chloroflexus sp.]|uniref:malto-oligosyltrehalose trehalohydrolase n=1 Tax=Chloroflexus sp. TaxID=1904827 RepID=UPI0021DDA45F|nr:malto-oligosyltrehalose trehalohydrolase [Chloroflexus sp.]GIV88761.1 MAG: malto-oligosyltrehalose trehalohydrolase [Chloroflexus sp.]
MFNLPQPGAIYRSDGTTAFTLWAPTAATVELIVLDPKPRTVTMKPIGYDCWHVVTEAPPGTRYRYRLDGQRERPDPASRCQPEGVHGPSAVVDHHFDWSDAAWRGVPLTDLVIYELHVGTFTPEGTFTAIIPHLPMLRDLGVTAIELMPVAHFPGQRNWGYDGVYLYAPHTVYGGVKGLKQLVDAAHAHGIAVILDVVYNHFGPEGNYLWDIAPPAFTDRYRTPWGSAINYDGPDSDLVRWLIIENALEWLREYHIDGLRLDATHAIFDVSPYHVLEELADRVREQAIRLGRPAYLFAEHPLNDPRFARPKVLGGYGLSGIWSDDFHHALHSFLTGEQNGYYAGFGSLAQIATAIERSFVFAGEYSPHARRRFGRDPSELAPEQFVVFLQNHDQVGNRAIGDRLGATLSEAQLRVAAATVLLSPYTPLIFMGEEYNEPAPFQYFTDHSDPALITGVREGRKREFAYFLRPGQEVPDPQDPTTFTRSKLNHTLRTVGRHAAHQAFYRELLRLRRELPGLRQRPRTHVQGQTIVVEWPRIRLLLNFGPDPIQIELPVASWQIRLDSGDPPVTILDGTSVTCSGYSAVLLTTHDE